MYLGQIQYVLDAVLAIVRIEGSLTEETDVSLGPHLMVLVFVLIYPMSCLILLQDFVEAGSFNIVALSNCILAVVEQILMVLLLLEKLLVLSELHYEGLARTCVKYVNHTCLYHFMQTDGVMTAVVEYF